MAVGNDDLAIDLIKTSLNRIISSIKLLGVVDLLILLGYISSGHTNHLQVLEFDIPIPYLSYFVLGMVIFFILSLLQKQDRIIFFYGSINDSSKKANAQFYLNTFPSILNLYAVSEAPSKNVRSFLLDNLALTITNLLIQVFITFGMLFYLGKKPILLWVLFGVAEFLVLEYSLARKQILYSEIFIDTDRKRKKNVSKFAIALSLVWVAYYIFVF